LGKYSNNASCRIAWRSKFSAEAYLYLPTLQEQDPEYNSMIIKMKQVLSNNNNNNNKKCLYDFGVIFCLYISNSRILYKLLHFDFCFLAKLRE
jgi:hypothetical protein